ncbi:MULTISPECIES: GTPase [unclassified Marinobacter]|uniref:GTPase n=1 Tax=unclassified Marinobacter TaxID=83889 RepID=UPI000BF816FB|nr:MULTISPECIES: GTPase domain-containing protein [unclassified Marinobacter]PFG11431.1 GTP-binding protein EngB required for normal cell division [Marinobacter sp. LV10MA510-1]PFG53259.1 GTP-binding protein EngB required for normal cell division [Marinobacter sp. LV10R520-4]
MFQESDVNDAVDDALDGLSHQIENELSIVVGGKVSSGKSSFLNALFSCPQHEPKFHVGAEAGVTTKPKAIELSPQVTVWDTPGLNDLDAVNVEITLDFLKKGHDLAILVLSGAADTAQKENFDVLKRNTDNNIIIILNKVDGISKADVLLLKSQWKESLALDANEEIYCCVSLGYGENDRIVCPFSGEETEVPVDDFGMPRTVQGVDEARKAVLKKLEKIDKDLLFLKSQQSKKKAAIVTISSACVTSAGFAFIPGSGVTITATQIGAICRLHYIYKEELISKSQVVAILPAYAMQAVGRNLFLWAKSILPPTGVVDAVAAGIAVSLTASMLVTINYILKNDSNLTDKVETKINYKKFSAELSGKVKNASLGDWINPSYWASMISKLV